MPVQFPSINSIVHSTTLKKLAWLSFAVALASFLVRFDVRVLNSDYLYLPTLYKDLTDWGGRWSEWYLPPAPYFFPDMALYSLVTFLTKNWALSYVLAGTLQTILFVFGWYLLAKLMKPLAAHGSESEWMIPLIPGLVLTLDGIEPVFNSLAIQPFLLTSHFGIALALPYLLAFLVLLVRRNKSDTTRFFMLIWTFIGCGLLSASDPLFVVSATFPLLLALAALAIHKRMGLRPLLYLGSTIILGTVTGHFARNAISLQPLPARYSLPASGNVAFRSFHAILDWAQECFTTEPIITLVVTLAVAIQLTFAARSLFPGRSPLRLDSGRIFISVLFSTSILCTIAAIIVTGSFEDQFSSRYFWPLITSLICSAPLLAVWKVESENRMTSFAALASLFILLVNAPSLADIGNLKRYLSYYPSEIAALDHELERRNLKVGVGTYWDAKYLSMVSRTDLRILQVYPNLEAQHWINDAGWYRNHRPQFVLIDTMSQAGASSYYRLEEPSFLRRFGNPSERFTASGKIVLVYNRSNDSLFWNFLRK